MLRLGALCCLMLATCLAAELPASPSPTESAKSAPSTVNGQISAGVFASCGIRNNGRGYCWGYNDDGQIGDGTKNASAVPRPISGGGRWLALSAGDWHNCGVKQDNTGYCWGYNGGRLGTGKKKPVQALVPQKLEGKWKDITAGHFHSCGLQTSGVAYCWGNNKNGRLGNGNKTEAPGGNHEGGDKGYVYSPVQVLGGNKWLSVCGKGSHSCGIQHGSKMYCWGGNLDGDLGIGTVGGEKLEPTRINGVWKKVSCGLKANCAINQYGDLYCWGALRGGENSVAEILPPKPTKIGGNGTWVQSSVGMQHVCGVKANGNAYCFGEGWHGQLGTGKRNKCPSSKPCKVNFDLKWKEVSVGEYSTCGVAENGCAYCWGEDVDGRLGNGKPNAFYLLPTLVSASCQWGSGNSAAR